MLIEVVQYLWCCLCKWCVWYDVVWWFEYVVQGLYEVVVVWYVLQVFFEGGKLFCRYVYIGQVVMQCIGVCECYVCQFDIQFKFGGYYVQEVCGVYVGQEVDMCFGYCYFGVFGYDMQMCGLFQVYVIVYGDVVYQCNDGFWELMQCVVELIFVNEELQLVVVVIYVVLLCKLIE